MVLRRFAILPALFSVLVLSASCASGGDPYDPDDPRLGQARLEVVGSSTFNIRPGQSANLRVRYVYEDGTAISGAPIDWAFDGLAGTASLSARQTETGSDGITAVDLTAGMEELTFRVVATPPVGNSVTFQIAVTQENAGSIAITMRYTGMETFDDFTPYLFRGVACDTIDPLRPPTADRIGSPVRDIRDRPGFAGIPPADNYSVMVLASIAGQPAAMGCKPGVIVQAGEEAVVVVDLLDLEANVRFEGTYDLSNRFNFAGAFPPSVETALEVLAEIADDDNIMGTGCAAAGTDDCWGQDPGAFVLDMIMRLTCAWDCTGAGGDYDACGGFGHVTDNHGFGDIQMLYRENFTSWGGAESRFFGGCAGYELAGVAAQNFINRAVGMYVPEVVLRFLDAASDLAAAITRARINSVLILQPEDEFGSIPFDHRLLIMEVSLRDLDGSEFFAMFDLREVGFTELSRTGLATAAGETLALPPHSFEMHFGRLIQYIYLNILLPRFGFTSTADMFATWIDCADVADAIHGAISGVTDRLTTAQYEMYCNEGLMAAGDYVDENIDGFIDVSATMTISGTAHGTEVSTDGIAQRLEDGMWTGSWDEMGTGDEIDGTFTGVRRTR
jgi:hypothetical protein